VIENVEPAQARHHQIENHEVCTILALQDVERLLPVESK